MRLLYLEEGKFQADASGEPRLVEFDLTATHAPSLTAVDGEQRIAAERVSR